MDDKNQQDLNPQPTLPSPEQNQPPTIQAPMPQAFATPQQPATNQNQSVVSPFDSSETSEAKSTKHKTYKLIIILSICVVAILLATGGTFYYWYSKQDHSVYSKLTTENYNQDGVNFSFEYPSILQPTSKLSAENADFRVAYDYEGGSNKIVVDMGVLPDNQVLQGLNLTPSQLLGQIKDQSGSYINALNKRNPDGYNSLYGSCTNNIVTSSNQTDVLCVDSNNGDTNVRIVGADTSYQYIMQLDMDNSLWAAHQKVWQKIEKSFSFQ